MNHPNIRKDDRLRTYIVIGAHRSGTSFVTHCLINTGVDMGDDLIGVSLGNPQGGCESTTWDTLANDIITHLGGKWSRHAEVDDDYTWAAIRSAREHFAGRIRALIKERAHGWWGIKNPKLSRIMFVVLPFILEVDDDPIVIVCARRRSKVTASIRERAQAVGRDVPTVEEYDRIVSDFYLRITDFISEFVNERYE